MNSIADSKYSPVRIFCVTLHDCSIYRPVRDAIYVSVPGRWSVFGQCFEHIRNCVKRTIVIILPYKMYLRWQLTILLNRHSPIPGLTKGRTFSVVSIHPIFDYAIQRIKDDLTDS